MRVARLASLASGLSALVHACGNPGEPAAPPAALSELIASRGLSITPAATAAAPLAWHVPAKACAQVYRISVSYDNPPFQESDSISTAVLGRQPSQESLHGPSPVGAVPEYETLPAALHFRGFRVGAVGQRRDIAIGRHELGPGAPTAACYERTWDPIEDAIALGWPKLTGRITRTGESWQGARVGGRCNRLPCVDPVEGRGGRQNHHLACVSPPWREHLAAMYEANGSRYAWIESTWDEGHPEPLVRTTRHALIAVDHGRPAYVRVVIDNKPAGVKRTWVLESLDACDGSLVAAGMPATEPDKISRERALQLFALPENELANLRAKGSAQPKVDENTADSDTADPDASTGTPRDG